tara:strand:- start:402 stop:1187 length:786 start_codon:yes stop_codon:yes gene_type:complete
MRYWNRNLITSTEREPSSSEASGIFNLNSHLIYKNADKWPTLGLVTNGLILHLDAGNSASYSGSGTTWTDLSSSSNNATLRNGPTYSSANQGYFTFDGTNDYADVSGSQTLASATFAGWLYRDGSQGNYDGIVFGRAGGQNVNGVMFFGTTNNLGYTWNAQANTYLYNSGLTIPNQEWCMFAVSISSSSANFYLYQSSGLTTATNSVSHTSNTVGNLDVGRDSDSSRYMKGSIAAVYLYNRALTSSEIQRNFDANKDRYGL